jgi:hypothetical protein
MGYNKRNDIRVSWSSILPRDYVPTSTTSSPPSKEQTASRHVKGDGSSSKRQSGGGEGGIGSSSINSTNSTNSNSNKAKEFLAESLVRDHACYECATVGPCGPAGLISEGELDKCSDCGRMFHRIECSSGPSSHLLKMHTRTHKRRHMHTYKKALAFTHTCTCIYSRPCAYSN